MLNSSAISSALPLAEQLDTAGVVLLPLGGSPLDHMVKASNVGVDAIVETEQGYIVDTFKVEEYANQIVEPFDQSRHDFVTEDVIGRAANAVQNVISVIRNRVAPSIGQLVEQVNMRMKGLPVSELARLRIVNTEGANALFNPALKRLIEKYEMTPPVEPPMNTALPRLTADAIYPLLETGIASLDTEVHAWVAGMGTMELEEVWNLFFSVLTPVNVDGNVAACIPNQYPFNTIIARNDSRSLIVFLLARNMLENDTVLEGTEMNLGDYRKTLQLFMEQAGRHLNRQLEKLEAAVTNGILVVTMGLNEIVVNTPVYNAWLEEGGDNDVLFGMAVSGKPTFLKDTINARAAEFKTIWHRHSQLISAADSSTQFNYLREQLVLCFEGMVQSEESEDGQKLTNHEVYSLVEEFKNVLDTMSSEDTKDMYTLCLKLICRTRYSKIPAERFLLKMNEVSKADPTLDAKETGAIATIEYICDWVASQFTVVGG